MGLIYSSLYHKEYIRRKKNSTPSANVMLKVLPLRLKF